MKPWGPVLIELAKPVSELERVDFWEGVEKYWKQVNAGIVFELRWKGPINEIEATEVVGSIFSDRDGWPFCIEELTVDGPKGQLTVRIRRTYGM